MSPPRLGFPLGVLASCICALLAGLAPAAQRVQDSGPAFVPDEVLVQFRGDVPAGRRAEARAAARAALVRRFANLDVEHLRVRGGADPRAVARALRARPDVRAAQPNYVRQVHAPPPPNDFFWLNNRLWGMERISAQPAWTTFGAGPHSVVIANIDTGVNYNHPDLAANIWRNPGEIPGNGIDDDGNGYIDDVFGIDTINGDADPFDDHGHGTHMAGTAAAVANNEVGVAGVAWNAKVLACKFINASGAGLDSGAVACFNYVVALKARGVNVRVSSNSWGRTRIGEPATVLKNAIDAAGAAGILNVFAAGNGRTNNDEAPFDPASFSSPSVIAVAASGEGDDRNQGNYGRTSVALAAPGANIISTFGGGYQSLDGTSSAAAHVTGAAALLFSHHPTLTVSQAKSTLIDSVDRSPQWEGLVASGGILNVYQALVGRSTNMLPTVALTSPASGVTLTAPATIRLAASATDPDGSVTMVEFFADGNLIGRDATAPFELLWSGVPPGVYALTAVATDNDGATAPSQVVTVRVDDAAGSAPFRGTPVRLPGTIEAEDFDHGGQGVAYFDRTPGNAGGVYRDTDVDIEATADAGGGYNLGWVSGGEWLHYTVEVAAAGLYDIELRVASSGAGGTFHVEEGGVNLTGPLTVPNTGGWQSWTTIRRTGVQLRAGVQVWRLVMDSNGATGAVGNFNHLRVVGPAPTAASTPLRGTPVRLPGTVEAEDFDHGGQGVAYFDRTPGNAGGVYRDTDVDVEATADAGGGYNLGWVSGSEWLHYTVDVAAAGLYDLEVRVASPGTGGTFHIEEGGRNLSGPLVVPDTGGWQAWHTIRGTGVQLRAGVQVWRLVMDSNGVTGAVGNINRFSVVASQASAPAAVAP
jgi:subtilisin family serine protease